MTDYTDPVCGMQMEPDAVASETSYEGTSYYFCSGNCRKQWDADPARYAKESGGVKASRTSA
jgi:P-type Cu+ transporter